MRKEGDAVTCVNEKLAWSSTCLDGHLWSFMTMFTTWTALMEEKRFYFCYWWTIMDYRSINNGGTGPKIQLLGSF